MRRLLFMIRDILVLLNIKLICLILNIFLICSDRGGETILHRAVRSGSLPTVKLIVDRLPKLLNSKSMLYEDTPAKIAGYTGHHTILKYLLEVGVKQIDEPARVDLLHGIYPNHETYNIMVDAILKTSGREGLSKVRHCDML